MMSYAFTTGALCPAVLLLYCILILPPPAFQQADRQYCSMACAVQHAEHLACLLCSQFTNSELRHDERRLLNHNQHDSLLAAEWSQLPCRRSPSSLQWYYRDNSSCLHLPKYSCPYCNASYQTKQFTCSAPPHKERLNPSTSKLHSALLHML